MKFKITSALTDPKEREKALLRKYRALHMLKNTDDFKILLEIFKDNWGRTVDEIVEEDNPREITLLQGGLKYMRQFYKLVDEASGEIDKLTAQLKRR